MQARQVLLSKQKTGAIAPVFYFHRIIMFPKKFFSSSSRKFEKGRLFHNIEIENH